MIDKYVPNSEMGKNSSDSAWMDYLLDAGQAGLVLFGFGKPGKQLQHHCTNGVGEGHCYGILELLQVLHAWNSALGIDSSVSGTACQQVW